MFIGLFATFVLVNLDLGVLPASSVKIKDELRISDSKFGALGSSFFLG